VYRLHIETVLSLFFYNKTLLYLLIALWLFLEFLHIKEINKEKLDILVKVNYNKSELAPLGRFRMEIYTHNFSPGMRITIPTNGKYEDLIKLNYDEKKVKIKNIIQSWNKRSLTLFGKVTIIKSLIVPQLTYLLSVLPK
jgi:hypothetical protein